MNFHTNTFPVMAFGNTPYALHVINVLSNGSLKLPKMDVLLSSFHASTNLLLRLPLLTKSVTFDRGLVSFQMPNKQYIGSLCVFIKWKRMILLCLSIHCFWVFSSRDEQSNMSRKYLVLKQRKHKVSNIKIKEVHGIQL